MLGVDVRNTFRGDDMFVSSKLEVAKMVLGSTATNEAEQFKDCMSAVSSGACGQGKSHHTLGFAAP